ncbi:MAG: ATP-binding cassette domain-containing protein, partial [Microvirga sp.]
MTPLLAVRDLATSFFTEDGTTRAVDGVSFDVGAGETLGIVGESGCGKSVTALSIMRLLPARLGRTVRGSVAFEGRDLLGLDESEMRAIRGNRIAMIFQEPMTSLNPVFTVGDQITEATRAHDRTASAGALRARAIAALQRVRIPAPERRYDEYPHQMSGGMRQRVMIAMALACEPDLLIADEPTTALDVTVQAQILDLLRELQQQTGMAIILITHDLGIVAE